MMETNKYEALVVGGGTAGCAAAYNLGRLGVKTLLVEKSIHLGGSITSGLVVPAMNTSKNSINNEFYTVLIAELQVLGGQVTYQGNPGWFNPELCKIALDRLLQKANVDVLFNSAVTSVTTNNKQLEGVTITSNLLSVYIAANYVVDATGNCEIGELSNCEFLQNNNENGNETENKKEIQPVSLRFIMSGINLKTFSEWILDLDKDRNVTSCETINGEIHLSTAYTWDKGGTQWALAPLFDDAVSKNILKDSDRNYFQVFTVPNMLTSLAFNCPRVCLDAAVDPFDSEQVSKALIEGRECIVRLSDFCKIYFPGFEKAYISNIADALGVRVSRRIKGVYVYTSEDLKSGKTFEHPVLAGNYPIDIHSDKKDKSVLEHTMQDYYLPLESLMSADYDNLFVVGRCLSADFMSQAALRIQPSCFSMGEGVAKHIANLNNDKL